MWRDRRAVSFKALAKKNKFLLSVRLFSLGNSMDSELELISLISQLTSLPKFLDWRWDSVTDSELISLINQIVYLVSSMDLNLQPKPDSEFMSLITQAISVFDSMDLNPELTPLSELISLLSQVISTDSDSNRKLEWDLDRPLCGTLFGEPEPELVSLIYQIFSLVSSMNSKSGKFISLCPQVGVELKKGRFLREKSVRDAMVSGTVYLETG